MLKVQNYINSVLEALELETFPVLGAHGANAQGLEYLAEHPIGISIWAMGHRPGSANEALSMLYSLASSAISHSYRGQAEEGGFVWVNFGSEDALRSMADGFSKLEMRFPASIRNYPVPRDPSQKLSTDNWTMEDLDTGAEADIFETIQRLQRNGDMIACEIPSNVLREGENAHTLHTNDLPPYQAIQENNDIVKGYLDELVLRLESQAAIVKILEDLFAEARTHQN